LLHEDAQGRLLRLRGGRALGIILRVRLAVLRVVLVALEGAFHPGCVFAARPATRKHLVRQIQELFHGVGHARAMGAARRGQDLNGRVKTRAHEERDENGTCCGTKTRLGTVVELLEGAVRWGGCGTREGPAPFWRGARCWEAAARCGGAREGCGGAGDARPRTLD